MTDVIGNPEEERKSDFFNQPWTQEAVHRYFYKQVCLSKSSTPLMQLCVESSVVLHDNKLCVHSKKYMQYVSCQRMVGSFSGTFLVLLTTS